MKNRFRYLVAVAVLSASSFAHATVTVDFNFDTALTGGVDQFAVAGIISLNFSVDNAGNVSMTTGASFYQIGELENHNNYTLAILDSWTAVGTVDPVFAGQEFTIDLSTNLNPNYPYQSAFVFDNTGGTDGALGVFIYDEEALDDVFSDAPGGTTEAKAPVSEQWLEEQRDGDVIISGISGPEGNAIQEPTESIYLRVDSRFVFPTDNTGFQLSSFSYDNATDPNTTDSHLMISDPLGQEVKYDLSSSTSGTVDVSGDDFWTNNQVETLVGFNQIRFSTDPNAADGNGASLSGFTFDLAPFYAGDLNRDGAMDQLDIDLFAAGWKSDTSSLDYYDGLLLGDVNADGSVDFTDWYEVRQSFVDAGLAAPTTFVATPEPSAFALAAVALGLLARRRF